MASNVKIPATGSGDATPIVNTDQVTADTSQVQNVQLVTVAAGVMTRTPATLPVSAASLPLPAGASTAAKQPALGTAGAASADVITVQGVASMTALKTDGSATTQPVSGTITANAGTGTLTVNAPVGTPVFARLSDGAAALTTSGGRLAVDGSGVTQPVSAASLPLPSGASTAAKQPALGTAGAASADVLTVQGVASMTALKVDGSGVTQPVSGTITANIGTAGTLALDASVTGTQVAQASTTSGQKGTLAQGAVTTAAPTYTTAQTNPLSLTTAGALRVDGSAVTQPVSGALTISGTASTNETQIAGTAIDVNSGAKSAGTQRVVLATDQPALTNALKVDGSAVTQPVSGTVTASRPVSTTATLSNVASSASSVTVVALNANRLGLVIVNDSTQVLYLKFGSTASATSYTYQLAAGATFEGPSGWSYTGIITGIWASANGNARVTELTA